MQNRHGQQKRTKYRLDAERAFIHDVPLPFPCEAWLGFAMLDQARTDGVHAIPGPQKRATGGTRQPDLFTDESIRRESALTTLLQR
jgi:hypothetical protein